MAAPRPGVVMREESRVTPLELFFDLVFVLAALIPAAVELSALVTLALLAALLVGLISYEARTYAELRDRLRHRLAAEAAD